MEIILKEDIVNLGYKNDIVTVKSGYGRNYLIPTGKAVIASSAKVNEAETIPLGDVSFGQQSVSLFKIGKGFKLTDEVRNYVSLDVLGIYLRDFGVQLGYALDTLAMDPLPLPEQEQLVQELHPKQLSA